MAWVPSSAFNRPAPVRYLTSAGYPNCAAARAAGRAPIYRGEAGYGRHLDADNDGVACEPYYGAGRLFR